MSQQESKPAMPFFDIGSRRIGPGNPVYIVAEMSANHGQSYDRAMRIVEAAKVAGADAIKVQTFSPDTHTIDSRKKWFVVGQGTPWAGRTLYDLYKEAMMPWDWQIKLKKAAEDLGLDFFSAAVDVTSVEFLEGIGVSVHKVSSFELVDTGLLEKIASTGKPVILSTGMATLAEIDEAIEVLVKGGAAGISLLKCTSAYPSPADQMNLQTIPDLMQRYDMAIGLSDHTMGVPVPAAAVALGASIVEKHFTLSRSIPGPDSSFSMEPKEFKVLVETIRTVEAAIGNVCYGPNVEEEKNLNFRRSLFVVEDIRPGELFTDKNLRSIRPGYGLHPRFLKEVIGLRATGAIDRGTPLQWHLVNKGE